MKKKALIIGISLAVTAGLVGVGIAAELNHEEKVPQRTVAEAGVKGYGRGLEESPLTADIEPQGRGRNLSEESHECDECTGEEKIRGFDAEGGRGPAEGAGNGIGRDSAEGLRRGSGNGAGRGQGDGNGTGNGSGFDRGNGSGTGMRKGAVS